MSEHTKEPWIVDCTNVMARTGEMTLALVAQICHNEADARRIVACVNACEGISTEQLESWICMSRPILQSIKELKAEADREAKQRDCLLNALREMLVIAESANWHDSFLDKARAAIARATGESK